MAKSTVHALTITVTNPPIPVELLPASNTTTVHPLSVSISGETVTLELPKAE